MILREGTITVLFVDSKGQMLVGTNDNGISVIEGEEVISTLSEKEGLPSDSVRCFAETSDGLYYIGSAADLAVAKQLEDGSLQIIKVLKWENPLSLQNPKENK